MTPEPSSRRRVRRRANLVVACIAIVGALWMWHLQQDRLQPTLEGFLFGWVVVTGIGAVVVHLVAWVLIAVAGDGRKP